MNLTPALATPSAGHAGHRSLFGADAGASAWAPGATAGRHARGGRAPRDSLRRLRDALASDRGVRRLTLAALLALTSLLYLVGLSASGYANEFYAAAAQAGSQDWWAFLWGSSDAGNSITVDKPPASLWVMALSIRLFGLSSWSLLVPQAVMGVLSVAVLYDMVRRDFGHWCGLLAGALLATTPVATLMFRFDNPDALLVLLLLCSASCVLRSLGCGAQDVDARGWCLDARANRARTGWMALAGVAMGLAFLNKQLQAFLVMPGFAAAFLVASPTRLRRRLLDSAVALGSMAVAAGWWVALTVLVPADMRPYFGGSETNSFVELTFWYNGLGRIFGNTVGNGSMAAQGILMGTGGEASLARLLSGVWATQWSWVLPAALASVPCALVASGREPRTDRRRAQVLLWAGWLAVTFLVFSYMEGTIHQYYTVALAPAAAALAAIGSRVLWELRARLWARVVAICAMLAGAAWASALVLGTTWLVVPLLCLVWACSLGAVGLMAAGAVRARAGRALPRPASLACAILAAASLLVVPVAHSLYTASQGHHGSIVTAGPSVTGSDAMGGMGGGPGGGRGAGGGSTAGPGGSGDGAGMGTPGSSAASGDGSPAGDGASASGGPSGSAGNSAAPGLGGNVPSGAGQDGSSRPSAPDGSSGGAPSAPDGSVPGSDGTGGMGAAGTDGAGAAGAGGDGTDDGADGVRAGSPASSADGARGGAAPGGQGGGMGGDTTVSDEVKALLLEDADSYTWVAAAVGSQSAAGYQLATERAVMPIGGFNGTDPSPTLDEFKAYVAEGRIHYFIAGGGGGAPGASSNESIAEWVAANYESQTVDGVTLYDLTAPLS